MASTFVFAVAGELAGERLDTADIVRRGDVSEDGLREKTAHALGLMEARLRELGVSWTDVTAIEVYTVHNIFPLMRKFLIPRLGLGAAKIHGIRWHYARPPIEEIEFEMDVRGCPRELVLRIAELENRGTGDYVNAKGTSQKSRREALRQPCVFACETSASL